MKGSTIVESCSLGGEGASRQYPTAFSGGRSAVKGNLQDGDAVQSDQPANTGNRASLVAQQ